MSEETVLEEKIYEYQPTDESGRAIGGKQVIKYTTNEELADKLREQNVLLIRKLREQTRKVRLGIVETEDIPEDAQRYDGPVEFNPRDLTDEERYEIARDLVDPTKSFDAASRLVEARIGAPLETLGHTLQSIQQDNINLRAKIEANAFVADNPDYYKCNENFEAITSWMVRYNLAPIRANYQKAYDTLKAQGLLVLGSAPVAQEIAVVETPLVEVTPKTEPVPVIPFSLNRENTSDIGTPIAPGSDITYKTPDGKTLTGLAAVSAMPSDEYRRRLVTDKEFGKKVDKLEAEARKARV